MRTRAWMLTVAAAWAVAVASQSAQAPQPRTLLHQQPAVSYDPTAVAPIVAEAGRTLATGASFDARRGYLAAVLEALDVPAASQILLFSKTGVQQNLTSPQNPRAFYFNDRVVVGHVPGATFLEVAVHDEAGGARFYSVAQDRAGAPVFTAERDCLRCHISANTLEVPGFIARSMFTGGDGRPHPQFGSFLVDHRRDYAERWGGWLVTGAPDTLRHLGNTIVTSPDRAPAASASEVPTLEGRVPTERYLSPYSDVTALAVFDHQMHAMNLLTRLAWQTRVAGPVTDATTSQGPLADLIQETADYLLFVDEAPLDGPIAGGSGFAEAFTARGPNDRRGRSLREFDRQTRLFRYPVSYLIYSPAVTSLPAPVRTALFARMRDVLDGRVGEPRYQRLSAELRSAALEILSETHDGWR